MASLNSSSKLSIRCLLSICSISVLIYLAYFVPATEGCEKVVTRKIFNFKDSSRTCIPLRQHMKGFLVITCRGSCRSRQDNHHLKDTASPAKTCSCCTPTKMRRRKVPMRCAQKTSAKYETVIFSVSVPTACKCRQCDDLPDNNKSDLYEFWN